MQRLPKFCTAYLNQLEETDWAATQVSLVHDDIDYQRIISSFLSTSYISHRGGQPQGVLPKTSDFIIVGSHFAQLTKLSLQNKATQKQFSSFQFLLWLSYLAFLQTKGYSADEIDGLLQLQSGHDERRRRRLIPRAIKINSIIQVIARRCKISIARATEVFFLYAMTPLQLLGISEEALQSMPDILSRTQRNWETCLTTYYTIPTLLLRLITTAGLATPTSLDEICAALGYDVATVLSCQPTDLYRVDKATHKANPGPLTILTDPGTQADVTRGHKATRKANPGPLTILTDPGTQADVTRGYKAATGTLTAYVPSTAKPSKRRRVEVEAGAVTRNVGDDIAPRIHDYFNSWKTDAADGRLVFVAQWPVPHSTDVLRTYWWSTLEAIKLCIGQQYAPSYVDFTMNYYHVELDIVKRLLPDPKLAEAIQQSSLYQQELRQWELSGSHGVFRTSSCIIGLWKGPKVSELCILQATVCRYVENEKL